MNAEEFRTTALKLPGVIEASHMNHPDFRVNGRIFATLAYPDESWGMVKLTPQQQRSFIKKAPVAFQSCRGVWGERGATNVRLALMKPEILGQALDAAYRNAIPPEKRKRAIKRPGKAAAGQLTKTSRATINTTKP